MLLTTLAVVVAVKIDGFCATVDGKPLVCVADGLAVVTEPLTGAAPPKTSPYSSQGAVQQIPGCRSAGALLVRGLLATSAKSNCYPAVGLWSTFYLAANSWCAN